MSTENFQNESVEQSDLRVTLCGVGDAGAEAVAGLIGKQRWQARFVVVNTSIKVSNQSEQIRYISLNEKGASRLEISCEPDQLKKLAEESSGSIREAFEDTDLILIITGLGRGTSSSIAPVVASIACESGVPAFCIASLPFDFEGSQRKRVAANALQLLKMNSSGVICLPNQEINEIDAIESLSPKDLYKVSQQTFSQIAGFMEQVIVGMNFPEIGFNDLKAVLNNKQTQSHFVRVAAEGNERADAVLNLLLNHPLVHEGDALTRADNILVHLSGDSKLRMPEIQSIMDRINSLCKNVDVVFGAAQSQEENAPLVLTVLFSQIVAVSVSGNAKMEYNLDQEETTQSFKEHLAPDAAPRSENPFAAPAPKELPAEQEKALLKQQAKGKKLKQSDLPLEVISRGRFEKSEKTIHNGEDLDVPTFVRKGIKL